MIKRRIDREKEIFEKVLALVRNELWNEPLACTIEKEDIADILKVAKEQAVSGLVANTIIRNKLPIGEDFTLEVCAIKQLHEKKGKEMNDEIVLFTDFLARRGLEYYVMKGQTFGTLYPYPLMRSTGDIDFYCPKSCYRKVQKAIEEKLGIEMKHDKSEIHDNFDIEGFQFEMHSSLTCFSYAKHQRYWEHFVEETLADSSFTVTLNGKAISALPPSLNAVYAYAHILEHFVEKILMLKQLCDWAMLLHVYRDVVDCEALAEHLRQLGLMKAYCAMGAWLVRKLGLPKEDFPFPLSEKDYQWVEPLTDDSIYWIERRRRMQKIKGPAAGLRHSLRTAGIVVRQSFRFYRLAPMEMICRFPQMAVWSMKKRFLD